MNKVIIEASKLRNKAIQSNSYIEAILSRIFIDMEKTAELGEMYVTLVIEKDIKDRVVEKLKFYGYDAYDIGNGWVKITWDNPTV